MDLSGTNVYVPEGIYGTDSLKPVAVTISWDAWEPQTVNDIWKGINCIRTARKRLGRTSKWSLLCEIHIACNYCDMKFWSWGFTRILIALVLRHEEKYEEYADSINSTVF